MEVAGEGPAPTPACPAPVTVTLLESRWLRAGPRLHRQQRCSRGPSPFPAGRGARWSQGRAQTWGGGHVGVGGDLMGGGEQARQAVLWP